MSVFVSICALVWMCACVHMHSWLLAVATRHSELLKIHSHMTDLVPHGVERVDRKGNTEDVYKCRAVKEGMRRRQVHRRSRAKNAELLVI